MSNDKTQSDDEVTIKDLPIVFKAKYLGSENARGMWGIKHTRRPVDHLVTIAKTLPPNKVLPLCNLTISTEGVSIETTMPKSPTKTWSYGIDSISYGVQDMVYTRVFAMIIIKDINDINKDNPFEVHAFVCDSRAVARKITYALAAAFQEYSKRVRESENADPLSKDTKMPPVKQKFAIDLRTPEEMQQESEDQETEA